MSKPSKKSIREAVALLASHNPLEHVAAVLEASTHKRYLVATMNALDTCSVLVSKVPRALRGDIKRALKEENNRDRIERGIRKDNKPAKARKQLDLPEPDREEDERGLDENGNALS